MFQQSELILLRHAVNDKLKSMQQYLQSDDIPDKEIAKQQQIYAQLIALNTKLVNQCPPGTFEDISLNADTPVLVIEDSLVDRDINMTLLKELGFNNVIGAKEGQEALVTMSKLQQNAEPVGLVLCDWNMPNMSGIDFLKIVRSDKNFWATPVFLVTSNHDRAHIITALKAGVSGYVVKPVAFDSIKRKLSPYIPIVNLGE